MPSPACVVTGYGFIGPQGHRIPSLLTALKEEKTGIGPVSLFDTKEFSSHIGGEIPSAVLSKELSSKEQKLDRASQLVLLAAREAIEHAELPTLPDREKEKIPVILGTTLGGMSSATLFYQQRLEKEPKLSPSLLREFLPSSQAHLIAAKYNLNGGIMMITNACASGTNAIGYGQQLICQNKAPIVVVGGYDPMSLFTYAGFHSLKLMAPQICSPFDKNRQGLNLGEGAGILVLENEKVAKKRGAPILASILGYGDSADAFHLTQPDPAGVGAYRAMEQAMTAAQIEPSAISYINAHGTATFHNDLMEYFALSQIFPKDTLISSTKGFTGHLLGGAGAIEAIISILALQYQFVPKNLGLEELDPKMNSLQILTETQTRKVDFVLSNSFGFGGVNASIVIGK